MLEVQGCSLGYQKEALLFNFCFGQSFGQRVLEPNEAYRSFLKGSIVVVVAVKILSILWVK